MNTIATIGGSLLALSMLAGCATPSATGQPTHTTIVSATPDHVAESLLADFLITTRATHAAAAAYNDRQLLFMGDQYCVVAADMLTEQWADAGHSRALLEDIATYVTEHPEYCDGTEPVWPLETTTAVG